VDSSLALRFPAFADMKARRVDRLGRFGPCPIPAPMGSGSQINRRCGLRRGSPGFLRQEEAGAAGAELSPRMKPVP